MILSCGCLKVSLQKVYYLFLLHPTQHMGTELPGPGVEPRSLQGKHGVLITGPHGSSEIVQKYQNMALLGPVVAPHRFNIGSGEIYTKQERRPLL